MVCMLGPSSVLTFLVAGMWYRFRDRPWRRAIQKGLLPVTAGRLISSAALLIKATTLNWSLGLLTAVVTVVLLTTKVHPMLVLGGAAALGAAGVVG
jgi:chromate transporter